MLLISSIASRLQPLQQKMPDFEKCNKAENHQPIFTINQTVIYIHIIHARTWPFKTWIVKWCCYELQFPPSAPLPGTFSPGIRCCRERLWCRSSGTLKPLGGQWPESFHKCSSLAVTDKFWSYSLIVPFRFGFGFDSFDCLFFQNLSNNL